MTEGKTMIFVTLVGFWTLLLILTNLFVDYLPANTQFMNYNTTECFTQYKWCNIPDTRTENPVQNIGYTISYLISTQINLINYIPIVNTFTPLFRIIAISYTEQISPILKMFLSMILILTSYIVYSLIRSGD